MIDPIRYRGRSIAPPGILKSVLPVDGLAGAVEWVIAHGYGLMFLAMCLEGPLVTIAAGFAAAMGYFNIFTVFGIAIAGDLVPDVILYAVGYFIRVHAVERMARRLGVESKNVKLMERLVHENLWKSLLVAKFAPLVSVIGLMFFGAFKVPFLRYMGICLVISVPKCLLLVLLGTQASWAYVSLQSFASREIVWIVGAFAVFGMFFGYRRLMRAAEKRLL